MGANTIVWRKQHGITLQNLSSEVDIERLFSLGWGYNAFQWAWIHCGPYPVLLESGASFLTVVCKVQWDISWLYIHTYKDALVYRRSFKFLLI